MLDFTCVLTTVLFLTSNALYLVLGSGNYRHFFHHAHHNHTVGTDHNETYSHWRDLDPLFIQEEWQIRSDNRNLNAAAGLIGAIAWFSFCIPLLNVAWIQSAGGRKHLASSACIAALAVGGSMAELLARLMYAGVDRIGTWLARGWNLDNWLGDDTNDMLGWRCLEVAYVLCRGIIMWVDSFEWLALFGIFTIIFFSVRADKTEAVFSRRWTVLGLLLAILCFIDFLSDIGRFLDWRAFSRVAAIISIVNTVILFPLWLLWLAIMLPDIRNNLEMRHNKSEEEAFVSESHQQIT